MTSQRLAWRIHEVLLTFTLARLFALMARGRLIGRPILDHSLIRYVSNSRRCLGVAHATRLRSKMQRSLKVLNDFLAILAFDTDLESAGACSRCRRSLALTICLGRRFRIFARLGAGWLAQHERIAHSHTITILTANAERGRRATLAMRRRLGWCLPRSVALLIWFR